MRILLTVSYQGTAYAGWQRQKNGPSVQEEIEKAIFAGTGQKIGITGASRTDAGVHALGQRAHFDIDTTIPPERMPFVLNRFLPRDIRVLSAGEVSPDFHARFCAKGKQYCYRIFNSRQGTALLRDFTYHVPVELDVPAMERAAQYLLGTHDFKAFCATGGSAKTTVRTIHEVSLKKEGEVITFRIRGNAFLYNMVRIIAGTLVYVGLHKLPENIIGEVLSGGKRVDLGITAPPQGLVLEKVFYDAAEEAGNGKIVPFWE